MSDSPSEGAYGGRWFDELRRLTNSTWGLGYADILRVREMDRAEVLGLLARTREPHWVLQLDSSSPEEFARAIVREAQAREAQRSWGLANPLFDLLAVFLPF
jgi:hypothetical protein